MSVPEILISHSEVDAFARCEQQHKFAHADKLAAKTVSDGLDRGIRDHTVMETYYTALMNGATWGEASDAAMNVLGNMSGEPDVNFASLNYLSECIPFFLRADKERIAAGWKVLAVEKEFRLSFPLKKLLTGQEVQITYPFKVDLIRQDPSGNNWVVDTKTVYNFYTADEMALMPQVGKYMGALRALEFPVKGGIMSMIRWRKLKEPTTETKHQWVDLRLTENKIINFFHEHIKQMERIAIYKLNPELWEKEVTRTLSYMVCKNCSFKMLCQMEIAGLDTSLARSVNFIPNTYGYKVDISGDE